MFVFLLPFAGGFTSASVMYSTRGQGASAEKNGKQFEPKCLKRVIKYEANLKKKKKKETKISLKWITNWVVWSILRKNASTPTKPHEVGSAYHFCPLTEPWWETDSLHLAYHPHQLQRNKNWIKLLKLCRKLLFAIFEQNQVPHITLETTFALRHNFLICWLWAFMAQRCIIINWLTVNLNIKHANQPCHFLKSICTSSPLCSAHDVNWSLNDKIYK